MGKKKRGWGLALLLLVVVIVCAVYFSGVNIPLLQPRGVIADKEFRLLILITLLMCIVVVPVFILLGFIVWKYREDNKVNKKYDPDWDGNRMIEGIWWLIPTLLIAVISVITWHATYALNPYNPIPSKNKTLPVQVIALDWKWLFIYPTLGVASINKVVFPVSTPVHFYLTSDAPMNSFWIPQLSGQIYNMPGMQTQLYVMADKIGDYNGWSANISGIGFAGMMFDAQATTKSQFELWVKHVYKTAPQLSLAEYDSLTKPSSYVPVSYYSHPVDNLFNDSILKYMGMESPSTSGNDASSLSMNKMKRMAM